MKPDGGGPAFPKNILDHGHGVTVVHESGMSLRDYFAAKAMQGWLSTYGETRHPAESGYAHIVASNAYAIADAMLKERKK